MSGKTALIGIIIFVLAAAGFGSYVGLERFLRPHEPVVERTLPPLDLARARGFTFAFVDNGGALQEASSRDEIPEEARELVRVDHPGVHRTERTASLVYVADLREQAPGGRYPYRVMSDAQFRALALPQMSDTSMHIKYEPEPPPPPVLRRKPARWRGGPRRASPAPVLVRGSGPRAAPAEGARAGGRSVILYSTSWCPACTQARAYLQGRGIPFVEHDIEKDEDANREYSEKCARIGQPSGRIPGLDVGGRLMIGFSPGRLEALLRR